jgi:hypothetical protein
MNLQALAVALALVGLGTSVAVAQGTPRGAVSAKDTARSSWPTSGAEVRVCHRTASTSDPFRLRSVSRRTVETHLRHGDLIAPATGGCPSRAGARLPTTAISAAP